MAIQVTCPGCHQRFQVSEKFAGKQGPCPKCKAVITIPKKEEEAVIHAPEQFGPKGTTGKPTFKPISRTETKFSAPVAVVTALGVVMLFVMAWFVGRTSGPEGPPLVLLAAGAIVLAPAAAFAAYAFLRDDDLEPYRGRSLWIRLAIVGLVYAAIWGIVDLLIKGYLFDGDPFESFQLLIVIPAMIALGAFAAHLALDLDVTTAAVHYGFYLLMTVLLRMTMMGTEHIV